MGKLIREYEVSSWQRVEVEPTKELAEIEKKIREDPHNAALWLEKGLELEKGSYYREAGECYARGISLDPFNGLLYRHRGHRFLSQWRFEDAAADFTLASRLIPENWDVWYHLGLSYFLLGNYEKAAWAYKVCYDLDDDPYPRIAVTDWYYMTLRRLGRHEEAKNILEPIAGSYPPEKIKDNGEYYRRLLVYKGVIPLEKAIPEDLSTLKDIEIVTLGFGISNYYYLEGNMEKSNKIIDMILETGNKSDCFFGFGYLAAMVDKKNRSR